MLDKFEFPNNYAFIAVRSVAREAFMKAPWVTGKAVLVNEFPKSGGTWMCRMMRDITGLTFQDNRIPTVSKAIIKHHTLKSYPIKKRVIVWRDPRDVMVSLYHHVFFVHEDYPFNQVAVDRARAEFDFADYDDVKANMPRFVEQHFRNPTTPRFTWAQFAHQWADDPNAVHTSYEALRSDPAAELAKVFDGLGMDVDPAEITRVVGQHDIKKVKQQSGNAKNSFVRRGKVGGFSDYLDNETLALIEDKCSPHMHKLGYERFT